MTAPYGNLHGRLGKEVRTEPPQADEVLATLVSVGIPLRLREPRE
jgi:hypothetical protein